MINIADHIKIIRVELDISPESVNQLILDAKNDSDIELSDTAAIFAVAEKYSIDLNKTDQIDTSFEEKSEDSDSQSEEKSNRVASDTLPTLRDIAKRNKKGIISCQGIISRMFRPTQLLMEGGTISMDATQSFDIQDNTGKLRITMDTSGYTKFESLQLRRGDILSLENVSLNIKNTKIREAVISNTSSVLKIAKDSVTNLNAMDIDVWQNIHTLKTMDPEHTQDKDFDLRGIVLRVDAANLKFPTVVYLGDSSLKITDRAAKVIIWDDRVQGVYEELKPGLDILIENCKVKPGKHNLSEVTIKDSSNITLLEFINKDIPDSLLEYITSTESLSSGKSNRPIVTEIDKLTTDNNLSAYLRIHSIGTLKTFNRRDKTEGQVLHLGIFDITGSISLSVWDDVAIKASNVLVGELIKIEQGYLKQSQYRGTELAVGKQGSIIIGPDISELPVDFELPTLEVPTMPIKQLADTAWQSASLMGKIVTIKPVHTFARKNNTTGSVQNLELLDTTGQVQVVAWDDYSKKYIDLKPGQLVHITNLDIRRTTKGINVIITNTTEIITELKDSDLYEWAKVIMMTTNQESISSSINPSQNFQSITLAKFTNEWKAELAEKLENDSQFSGELIQFTAKIVNTENYPPYYLGCPSCSKKVTLISDSKGECQEHKIVKPEHKIRVPLIFEEDGCTQTIVTLGKVAETLTNFNPTSIKQFLFENNFNDVLLNNEINDRVVNKEVTVKGIASLRKVKTQNGLEKRWDVKIFSIKVL